MKRYNAEWISENWRRLIFISLILVLIPSFIYHFATIKPELWNKELRKQVREGLEREIKEINLPFGTSVNEIYNFDKNFLILIQMRYRTEINEQQFANFLTTELQKKGWFYYGRENSGYQFCRGQADASIFSKGNGGLFGDGANYVELNFTMGTRPLFDFNNSRPADCK